jgi:uncharacterized membrane protein
MPKPTASSRRSRAATVAVVLTVIGALLMFAGPVLDFFGVSNGLLPAYPGIQPSVAPTLNTTLGWFFLGVLLVAAGRVTTAVEDVRATRRKCGHKLTDAAH